ncbi:MAG: EFR1 family ferrodoxin [Promethearchaeota archaeon]
MKIALIYFSATGNTRTIADQIKQQLTLAKIKIDTIDITTPDVREGLLNSLDHDKIIFGFPIYYRRAPEIIRTWLKKLKKKERKCAVYFTYGGVTTTGVALQDIVSILNERGFNLLAAAEFLGSHTFNLAGWNLMNDRPNEEDKTVARTFAQEILKKFTNKNVKPIYFKPLSRYENKNFDEKARSTKKIIPLPYIIPKACVYCGNCEKSCPNRAIVMQKSKINKMKCIRCLRCLIICPENAIKIKNMSILLEFLKTRQDLSEITLNKKKSKIYI